MRPFFPRSSRSPEKEAYWRCHLESQFSSGVSIRAYCRQHGLSEPSFHFWRREIKKRDAKAMAPPPPPVESPVAVAGDRDSFGSSSANTAAATHAAPFHGATTRVADRRAKRSGSARPSITGAVRSPVRSDPAGLVALEIVGDAASPLTSSASSRATASFSASPPSTKAATLEVELPGGVVIRLREEVSAEVLQRVIVACERSRHVVGTEAGVPGREVSSC
jgi:hypothetical protein